MLETSHAEELTPPRRFAQYRLQKLLRISRAGIYKRKTKMTEKATGKTVELVRFLNVWNKHELDLVDWITRGKIML